MCTRNQYIFASLHPGEMQIRFGRNESKEKNNNKTNKQKKVWWGRSKSSDVEKANVTRSVSIVDREEGQNCGMNE